jgi:L-threonylcarbamoyladenylate synthase
MKTEILRSDHPVALRHSIDVLLNGGLVAFPTDTVYGLAAMPFQDESVERLFFAKGRNSERAIAILIGELDDLPRVTGEISEKVSRLVKTFWPGPLTLIVPGNPSLPLKLSTNNTLGVRMPDHELSLLLLREIGPLAVTSANLSGKENTNTAQEVMDQLGGRVHLILDGGRTKGRVPSTVVDCTSSEIEILRKGPISLKKLQAALSVDANSPE